MELSRVIVYTIESGYEITLCPDLKWPGISVTMSHQISDCHSRAFVSLGQLNHADDPIFADAMMADAIAIACEKLKRLESEKLQQKASDTTGEGVE